MPFILVTGVFGVATTVLSFLGAPIWTIFLTYAASAFLPELGPMSRARWVHIFRDDPDTLHTALSLEQILDEGAFVVGPILGVMLGTTWFPRPGCSGPALLHRGVFIFLSARATEPPVVARADRPRGLAVGRPGLFVVAAILTMVGSSSGRTR